MLIFLKSNFLQSLKSVQIEHYIPFYDECQLIDEFAHYL